MDIIHRIIENNRAAIREHFEEGYEQIAYVCPEEEVIVIVSQNGNSEIGVQVVFGYFTVNSCGVEVEADVLNKIQEDDEKCCG